MNDFLQELSLQEMHEVEIGILSFIHEICADNHLSYWMAYGTLLGAVRHQGFIPWDDDVDIWMPRKDYTKFVELMKTRKGQYRLLSAENHPDYYFAFARVTDSRTLLKRKGLIEISGFGVFVDVFPLDDAPPEEVEKEWQAKVEKLGKMTRRSVPLSAHYQEHSWKTIKRAVRLFPIRLLVGRKGFERYRTQWIATLSQYSNDQSKAENYVVMGIKKKLKKTLFEKTIHLPFEGKMFNAPEKYDELLTQIYGDYLTLPPLEERTLKHDHVTAYWKE